MDLLTVESSHQIVSSVLSGSNQKISSDEHMNTRRSALHYAWVIAAITFVVLLIEAALCLYQGVRGQMVWMQ